MTLAKLAEPAFPARARERGERYFYQGRVAIKNFGRDFLKAVVRGDERYFVELTLTEARLELACTCPFFIDNGPCKHAWAALLMADERNLMQPPAAITALEVSREAAEDGTASCPPPSADGPLQSVADVGSVWNPLPVQPAVPPLPQRPLPLWKQQLMVHQPGVLMPEVNPVWTREHQVRYVLSRQGSAGGGELLLLSLEFCTRKKNGGWSMAKPLRLTAEELDLVGEPQDRRLLAMLASAMDPYGYGGPKTPATVALRSRTQAELLLPLLVQTGRCYVSATGTGTGGQLLRRADVAEPWTFCASVTWHETKDACILSGRFERAGVTLELLAPFLLPHGWLAMQGALMRLEEGTALGLVGALRKAHNKIIVPENAVDALLQQLLEFGRLPKLTLPEEWRVREEKHEPRFQLVVGRASLPGPADLLPARCLVEYDGVQFTPAATGEMHFDAASRRLLRRDRAAEQRALAVLKEMGLKADPLRDEWSHNIAERQLSAAVCRLLNEGWRVEALGRPYRRGGTFKLNVSSGVDWFELRGAMDFEGQQVELPALLAALKKNEPLVKLGDGSFGILPEDWLKRYGRFAELGTEEEDHLRFSRRQAGVLDALLAAQPEATCDALFDGVRKELETFSKLQPAVVPAGFQGQLRGYQCEGLAWLHFLRRFGFGGCLADDMGLGKTVQVLALLEERRAAREAGTEAGPRTSLVVAPRSLIFNWIAEAARFTPRLRLLAHTGIERNATAETLKDYDVVLTTYGTLRNDIAEFKDVEFDCVILDEAQAIKNVAAATTKATRLLRARQRLALSGTPVQNHLGELWSLFEFLNPGMLGAASVFKLATAEPDEATRALLARALRPFILRRTKGQVAKDLPERTEETIFCELEPKQRRLYDELRGHYRQSLLERVERDGLAKSKMHVLEALLRLRQAACHPALIEKKHAALPSAKLDALLPQLAEVLEENHKALVFSQFTSLLALVRQRLDAAGTPYEYLDGQTKDREACVRHFQNDPDCKLFLISLKAGGLGLNLTAAEYVFLLDPWWNPAIEAQAIDRAHRIGQSQQVFAYRLIARDTVEEKILELQKTKRALADAIIGAENSLLGGLQRQDLELLLS